MKRASAKLSDVMAELSAYSREPFQRRLAEQLVARPSMAALRKFSKNHPDRWAQMLAITGRLAGYTEKTETVNTTNLNIFMAVARMSDSQIRARLDELNTSLQADPQALTPSSGTLDLQAVAPSSTADMEMADSAEAPSAIPSSRAATAEEAGPTQPQSVAQQLQSVIRERYRVAQTYNPHDPA